MGRTAMKVFQAVLAALAITTPLAAAPVACQAGTVATYQQYTDGCFIGDKLFDTFNLTSVGTKTILDTEVEITPIMGPDIGLLFTGPFTANGLQVVDTGISFFVSTLSGLPLITGSRLEGTIVTDGIGGANVNEIGVVASPLGHIPPVFNLQIGGLVGGVFSDEVSGLEASRIRITKDVFVTGNLLGSASIESFQNTYQQIPEPGTWSLMASGMVAAVLIRRRTQPRQ
jgi:hypothetical protein